MARWSKVNFYWVFFTKDTELGASTTTRSQSKCILRLELPLAWYKCHVQLKTHPRGKWYTGTSQLRILEWIWTWPSVSRLFLVKDSPVNFAVWLANIDSHFLGLWTWTISLPLGPLRRCFVYLHQTLSWYDITFFPATSFLIQMPWPLKALFLLLQTCQAGSDLENLAWSVLST